MATTISRGRRNQRESRNKTMQNPLKPQGLPAEVSAYSLEHINSMGLDNPRVVRALQDITRMNSMPSGNPYLMLKSYRINTTILMNWAFAQQSLQKDTQRELDVMQGMTGERSNKRWTDQEDNVLVEFAAKGEHSLVELSTMMGRSPGSVTSRLSHLVGIRRLSQEVAGKLTGFIDGEPVEGYLIGTVTKSSAA